MTGAVCRTQPVSVGIRPAVVSVRVPSVGWAGTLAIATPDAGSPAPRIATAAEACHRTGPRVPRDAQPLRSCDARPGLPRAADLCPWQPPQPRWRLLAPGPQRD